MESVKDFDSTIYRFVKEEEQRQANKVRLIASENYVSKSVLETTGCVLTNKYSEGYAGNRYYEGQQIIDQIENIAIERAKDLFGAEHVNVQPYSGSPANLATFLAFLKPGDTILGMALPHGGHLTHGAKVSISGRYFDAQSYELDAASGLINYDQILDKARRVKPKIIIAGHSAYPRIIDFKKFREIADEVNGLLMVDMAHFSGLVAGGVHPSPIPYADVVTTTTHKSLRGPRGAMILCKAKHAQAIDKAVFPGIQGGPHDNTTAAIAVALKEASSESFKRYARQIIANAKTLAGALMEKGFRLITGGTDNHLLLVDLSNKGVSGKKAAKALDRAGIVVNYNAIPFDTKKPNDPSGIRLGTPAVTSRGFKEKEMIFVSELIERIISDPDNDSLIESTAVEIKTFCKDFPAPGLEHLV
jgi:glycine hydroxymethyltransferase